MISGMKTSSMIGFRFSSSVQNRALVLGNRPFQRHMSAERVARGVQHFQGGQYHRLGHTLLAPLRFDELALAGDLPGKVRPSAPADRHADGLGEVVHVGHRWLGCSRPVSAKTALRFGTSSSRATRRVAVLSATAAHADDVVFRPSRGPCVQAPPSPGRRYR